MRSDKQNLQKISQLASRTRTAMTKAYNQMKQEGLDIHIFETIRTQAKQREYVNKGTSKTMRSYHLVGQAIDILPFDSNGNFSWNETLYRTPQYKRVVAIMQANGFSWGYAMWGWDMPHFQFDSIPYGTDSFSTGRPTVEKPNNSKGGTIYVQAGQEFLNSRNYPKKAFFGQLSVDGIAGTLSFNASVRVYQYFAGAKIDGIFGQESKTKGVTLRRKNDRKWWTHLLQSVLNFHGAKLAVDGIFGTGTEQAVRNFQKANGLSVDGIAGKNTWEKLLKR